MQRIEHRNLLSLSSERETALLKNRNAIKILVENEKFSKGNTEECDYRKEKKKYEFELRRTKTQKSRTMQTRHLHVTE
jgi:hypothetical protein